MLDEAMRSDNKTSHQRKKNCHSHGLIVLKLQLAGHLLIVLPCLGGALDGVVGHRHLPPRPRRPVNLHLHVADALADPRRVTLKCKNAGMIIIIDGDRGSVSVAQGGLRGNVGGDAHRAVAGGDGAWLQDGDLSSVHDAWITEAHIEVLILFKNIIIDNANSELFCGLTRLENQGALCKLIV